MKQFEKPAIQVEQFAVEDVITNSGNQLPPIPGGAGSNGDDKSITPLT